MPPETATWNRINTVKVTITRQIDDATGQFVGDPVASIDWVKTTSANTHPKNGGGIPTLNATRKNQANLIMDDCLAFAKNQEGINGP